MNLQKRMGLWTDASLKFEHFYKYSIMDIQLLGNVELIILEMEQESIRMHHKQKRPGFKFGPTDNPRLLIQLEGISRFWLYGFYEALRKFREELSTDGEKRVFAEPFEELNEIFHYIEITRMPLAKKEVAKVKGTTHLPRILFYPTLGSSGWEVYSKRENDFVTISRREITDRFLSVCEKIVIPDKIAK